MLDLGAEDDVALIGTEAVPGGVDAGKPAGPETIRGMLLRRYIEFAVDRPGQTALAFLAIFVAMGLAGYLLFPVHGFMTHEGTPKGPVESLREDSFQLAQEATVFDPAMISLPCPAQSVRSDRVSLVFWRPDGGTMLTEASMAVVRKIEKTVSEKAGFADVCWTIAPPGQAAAASVDPGVYARLMPCLAASCASALGACTSDTECGGLLAAVAKAVATGDAAGAPEAGAVKAAVAASPALLNLLIAVVQCSDASCGTALASLLLGGVCAPAMSLTSFLWPTPNTGCEPGGTFTPSGLALGRSGLAIGETLAALEGPAGAGPGHATRPLFCTPNGTDCGTATGRCIAPSPDNLMPFIAADYDRATHPSSPFLRSTFWFATQMPAATPRDPVLPLPQRKLPY